MNSGPLSVISIAGFPRASIKRCSTSATRRPPIEVSTSIARHARVKSSTTVRRRKRRPSSSTSRTKSSDQRSLIRVGAPSVERPSPTSAQARRSLSLNFVWIARTAVRCATGVRPFFDERLQGLVIECEIGDQALEPAVFMLERAQAPGLIHLEARVLGFPAIEGLLADGVTPAEVDALRPRLGFLQDPDDLLLGEPLSLHRGASPRAS